MLYFYMGEHLPHKAILCGIFIYKFFLDKKTFLSYYYSVKL